MNALALFREYMGVGLLIIWYLVALLHLFWTEKRKDRRILFVYVPLILLVLFFNPLCYLIFDRLLGEEIFYRMLWLLPVTMTLGYDIVRLCQELQGKKRVVFGFVAVTILVISGRLVYTLPQFSRAENIHHVPQEVVEICDCIEVPGIEVLAAFPPEMLHFVRQYSSTICMPYGREVLLDEFSELEFVMHYQQVDVSRLAELAKAQNCHYIILSAQKELTGRMEDYDYEMIKQVGDYLVYRDNSSDFYLSAE
ncbi:MAG: hypothetical protein E7295_08330 [Lachnospiraceae bacterium]|jgi:hypothetical protein|nr:hypothetical protein [Lachnospiraceae bacterium]